MTGRKEETMKHFPNIPGEHYRVGRLALTKVAEINCAGTHHGEGTRLGPEVGWVICRIPRTHWILWWVTN